MTVRRRPLLVGAVACILAMIVSSGVGATPEIPVLATAAGEFQPARGQNHFAWEQNTRAHPRHYDVYVRADGGSAIKVNARGWNGAMGGIDGDTLVYQQFRGSRSDILFFNLISGTRFKAPAGVNTGYWEYWPSLSGQWLLYAKELDNGLRALILFNLNSKERRTLDRTERAESFLGPGQVNGDFVTWSTCKSRCNVFRYHIPTGLGSRIPNREGHHRAPSITPTGTVYYVRSGKQCGAGETLVRFPIDGPETTLVQLPKGVGIADTYAFARPNGSTEIFFDRTTCGRPAASDILMVPLGSITILKDADPNDPQDFEFNTSASLAPEPNFFLDDDPDPALSNQRTFSDLVPGSYTVTEVAIPANWTLTGLGCVGGGANTGSNLATATATIGLDPGESVVCSFTDTKQGSITIVKDADPDDPQDFEFDPSANLDAGPNFLLDDDADSSLSNQKTYSNLLPGNYSVQEVNGPSLWALTSLTCSGGGPNTTASIVDATAAIGLDPGEAVICTFTNTFIGL